jgi:hypothetical protein
MLNNFNSAPVGLLKYPYNMMRLDAVLGLLNLVYLKIIKSKYLSEILVVYQWVLHTPFPD